jgi:hypothetical protein
VRVLDDPHSPAGTEELGSEGNSELVFSGRVYPTLGWQWGLLGTYGTGVGPQDHRLALLDLIAKFEPSRHLNLWLGRIPIPSDRTSLGHFTTALAWTPAGIYSNFVPPVGFRRGSDNRGTGATLWGQAGRLFYHVGVFDPGTLDMGHLLSGRVEFQFLAKETGFFRSNGYGSGKNVFSLALSAQRQSRGSQGPVTLDDFHALGGDLLLNLVGDSAGALDLDLAVCKTWGENEPIEHHFSALLSYLLPQELSQGRFQPLFRLQRAVAKGGGSLMLIDGQLGYVLDGPRARILVLYQYGQLPEGKRNLFLLGLQLATR